MPLRATPPDPGGADGAPSEHYLDTASLLLHLHIPRTGGTTMQAVFAEQYGERSVLVIQGMQPLSGLRRLIGGEMGLATRVVSTSHPFGISELVGATWITAVLRSPVERVCSYIDYLRREPGEASSRWHQLHLLANEVSIDEYLLEAKDPEVDNWQVRMLSGRGALPGYGQNHSALLDIAQSNLEKVDVVGLTERMAESVEAFARRLGWTAPTLPHRHASNPSTVRARRNLPSSTIASIRELNRMDERLYQTAVERFLAARSDSGQVG